MLELSDLHLRPYSALAAKEHARAPHCKYQELCTRTSVKQFQLVGPCRN